MSIVDCRRSNEEFNYRLRSAAMCLWNFVRNHQPQANLFLDERCGFSRCIEPSHFIMADFASGNGTTFFPNPVEYFIRIWNRADS